MEVRMRRPIARAEKSCPPAVPPLKRAALGWLRGIVLIAMMAAAGRAAADDALARLHFAFTETLVVRREDGSVHGLGDLRGERVGTLEGSLALDLVRAAPGVEAVLYEGVEEPYLDLERGRLRAVLLDNIIAGRYALDRKSTRLNSSHGYISYAVFCLKKKKKKQNSRSACTNTTRT